MVKRKKATAGLSYVLGPIHLDFTVAREVKNGIGSIGAVVGTNGGDARTIILPEPIDYITDDIRASASYSGEIRQVALEYHYSQFNNREETLRWDGPYDVHFNPPTFTFEPYQSPLPSNGFQGRHQLPPDNFAHDLSLSGGMNLPYATRISGRVGYGQSKQNQTLLPFTTSTDTSLLPRKSADAEIDTTLLWLNVASRPLPRLSLDGQYKNFTTKNKTPRDLFLYIKTDNVLGLQPAVNAETAVFNLPYDWAQNLMKLDASYYLLTGTTFKLGYDIDTINRDYREIKKTRENTYRAGLRSTYFSKAHAGLNFSSGKRKGLDDYDQAKIFVGLFYNFTGDEYDRSILGLQDRDDRSATVDVAFTPFEIASLHAFYTRQEIDFRQVGRVFGIPQAPDFADPNRNWQIDHDDKTDTVGTGFNLSLMDHRVTISTTYSFSKSNISTDITAGSALPPPIDLPDLTTHLHSVDISGQSKITERMSVGVSYLYESYKSEDFATKGVSPASTAIPAVLTLSGSVPDYRA